VPDDVESATDDSELVTEGRARKPAGEMSVVELNTSIADGPAFRCSPDDVNAMARMFQCQRGKRPDIETRNLRWNI
jgi:hypothetical protein